MRAYLWERSGLVLVYLIMLERTFWMEVWEIIYGPSFLVKPEEIEHDLKKIVVVVVTYNQLCLLLSYWKALSFLNNYDLLSFVFKVQNVSFFSINYLDLQYPHNFLKIYSLF